jgi:hypothetical protein
MIRGVNPNISPQTNDDYSNTLLQQSHQLELFVKTADYIQIFQNKFYEN